MHWVIDTAVQVIDDTLGESACVGCVHFAKCSSAPRQAKSGEQGRAEQPSLINYSRLPCTTPLSAKGGMDARLDGWMDGLDGWREEGDGEQMKEGEGLKGFLERGKKKRKSKRALERTREKRR